VSLLVCIVISCLVKDQVVSDVADVSECDTLACV